MTDLTTQNEFIARHIGPRDADTAAMLGTLGFDSLDALTASVIPESIKGTSVLGQTPGLSEADALAKIKAIAGHNQQLKTYIGQGYYGTHTPSAILRNLLENPAWYTAYTPYQPEISQGRLEALLNFQTLIIDLTGLSIANPPPRPPSSPAPPPPPPPRPARPPAAAAGLPGAWAGSKSASPDAPTSRAG